MTSISKHVFEAACKDKDCSFFIHPWHKNCLQGNLECYKQSMIGSAKFYAIVYLAQILMRGRKMFKNKEEWRKMGEYYVRSTLFGFAVCASANTLACLFRYMQGGTTKYYTYILIPNMINGIGIFLEPPSRRGLVVNLFCNLVIEYCLRGLQKHGFITMGKSKQTLLFMMGSAFLFYLMRLEGDRKSRTPLFWLFTPERVRRKVEDSENPCPHKGPCLTYVGKGFLKLFGAGFAITLLRVLLPKIKTPLQALSSVGRSHLKMALFFASYIGIYRAVICCLCRMRGYDSAKYALPAGYAAGLSFLFNPSLSVSIASFTAALKLYSTILYEKGVLPSNVPLPEILFCLSQGILFHARFMHADICPKYVFNLMKTVSNGGTELLYSNMIQAIKNMN